MKDLKEFTKQDVTVIPGAFDAIVIKVELITAAEAYPNSTYNKEGDQVIAITWENDKYKISKTEKYAFFNETNLTDNSKMGKYLKKYVTFDTQTTIQVYKNDKGFYEVSL
jgi:hypothetical protein